MKKAKLFLTTTDIADLTGYSMRNARNIMKWVKIERNLPNKQVISIYAFCSSFDFPVEVIYEYINTPNFKLQPINEQAVRDEQDQKRMQAISKLDLTVLEPLIHKSTGKNQTN